MTSSASQDAGNGGDASGPGRSPYDAEQVVARARQHDPGMPTETARLLAVSAWEHLRAMGTLDAPELARRLLAEHPDAGATPAAVVARAAVDHCTANEILPS